MVLNNSDLLFPVLQTEPLVGDYNREESQKAATFQRNIIYWKTWSDDDEELEVLNRDSELVCFYFVFLWGIPNISEQLLNAD